MKGKDQWSIPELMHAMTILSYFHAWACFCMANGLQLESDMNFFNKEIKTVFSEDKNFPQEAYESSIDILIKTS